MSMPAHVIDRISDLSNRYAAMRQKAGDRQFDRRQSEGKRVFRRRRSSDSGWDSPQEDRDRPLSQSNSLIRTGDFVSLTSLTRCW